MFFTSPPNSNGKTRRYTIRYGAMILALITSVLLWINSGKIEIYVFVAFLGAARYNGDRWN